MVIPLLQTIQLLQNYNNKIIIKNSTKIETYTNKIIKTIFF